MDLIQADPLFVYSDGGAAIRKAMLNASPAVTAKDPDPSELSVLIMVRKGDVYWIADWMVSGTAML